VASSSHEAAVANITTHEPSPAALHIFRDIKAAEFTEMAVQGIATMRFGMSLPMFDPSPLLHCGIAPNLGPLYLASGI